MLLLMLKEDKVNCNPEFLCEACKYWRSGATEDTVDLTQCVMINEEESKRSSNFYNSCLSFRKTIQVLAYVFSTLWSVIKPSLFEKVEHTEKGN